LQSVVEVVGEQLNADVLVTAGTGPPLIGTGSGVRLDGAGVGVRFVPIGPPEAMATLLWMITPFETGDRC